MTMTFSEMEVETVVSTSQADGLREFVINFTRLCAPTSVVQTKIDKARFTWSVESVVEINDVTFTFIRVYENVTDVILEILCIVDTPDSTTKNIFAVSS